jgi:hypothetical protein
VSTVLTALLVLGAIYATTCRLWPYVTCPRCHGTGRSRSPSGSAWRDCARCGGQGKRVRWGAGLFDRRR